MKTITIKFPLKRATEVAIWLYSLDMTVLMSWSEDGLLDDNTIYCILRVNTENEHIPGTLQLEKIRERNYIKVIN